MYVRESQVRYQPIVIAPSVEPVTPSLPIIEGFAEKPFTEDLLQHLSGLRHMLAQESLKISDTGSEGGAELGASRPAARPAIERG
jgi:hypothetical protein